MEKGRDKVIFFKKMRGFLSLFATRLLGTLATYLSQTKRKYTFINLVSSSFFLFVHKKVLIVEN